MREVLVRAAYLLRHPVVLGIFLVLAGAGIAVTYLPLFGSPGYELSEALAIGCGVLGGIVAVVAGRLERRLIQGKDPRPARASRLERPLGAVCAAVGAAWLIQLGSVTIPIVVALFRTMNAGRCDPFIHIGFLPTLVIPSSLLAAAVGVFCSLLCRTLLKAALLYFGLLGVSAVITSWPLYFGPQVYAFNHLLGYLPGPLYDEAIRFPTALLWYRIGTVAVVMLVLAVGAILLDMTEGFLRRPFLRAAPLALAIAAACALFLIESRAAELGFRMSSDFLEEKLGGIRQSEHFRVVFPRAKTKLEAERLIRDLEFRYSQVNAFLGSAPRERINVYVYRTPEEKRELVGAANTQYAKPWRLELHINDANFPNPTVKHELAHVMASSIAPGPFKVTSRFRVVPNIAIIEGAAVAADNPITELTLHGWAAGMRRQKLAPDIRQLFRIEKFYASAAPRAYAIAGSFLAYLVEQYGTEKFQLLYAHGDFEQSYQRSLDALASEWERFVDALPLDNAAMNQAFTRFRQGAIFSHVCAREVAELRRRVEESADSDPEAALKLLGRAHKIEPNEPSFELLRAGVLLRLDRGAEASDALKQLVKLVSDRPPLAAEVATAQANLAHAQGRDDEARMYLESTLTLNSGGSLLRTAEIKLAALSMKAGRVIWAYLEPGNDVARVLRLREALIENPNEALLLYLLGRRLSMSGEPGLAGRFLQQSLARPLPPSVGMEAWRLKIESDYLSGDCPAVRDDRGRAPSFGEAFQQAARDWVDRCDFETKYFNGALAPKTAFE